MARNTRRGTNGSKRHQQRREGVLPQGEVKHDSQQMDERKRVAHESKQDRSSPRGAQPDDHSSMPSPGDIGAPEYYARTAPPKIARPGPVRHEAVEEEEEED